MDDEGKRVAQFTCGRFVRAVALKFRYSVKAIVAAYRNIGIGQKNQAFSTRSLKACEKTPNRSNVGKAHDELGVRDD